MHHAALALLAAEEPVFATWRYFKFDVPAERLAEALPVFHQKGFLGLNLTIPHKVLAVGLIEHVDPAAEEAGAVNTLRRTATGFEGFNTDSYGITRAVADAFASPLQGADVILLGAGGAARAAAVACLREGCASLWIGNRSQANLAALLGTLTPVATRHGAQPRGFAPGAPPGDLPADALVINATSAGLKPGDPSPIDLSRLPGRPRVYDMIYNPRETPLLRQAAALGLESANGLSMLAHQGAHALELWTNRSVDASAMLDACTHAITGR
jgi:shikimate dehydrogenase